jgi:hypothetical protein
MANHKIDPFEGFLNDFHYQQALLKETLIHRTNVLQVAIKMVEELEEICPSLEAAHTLHQLKRKLSYGKSLDFSMDRIMADLEEIAQKAHENWKEVNT